MTQAMYDETITFGMVVVTALLYMVAIQTIAIIVTATPSRTPFTLITQSLSSVIRHSLPATILGPLLG